MLAGAAAPYDLIVIGAGAAGSTAASEARGQGARVAMTEQWKVVARASTRAAIQQKPSSEPLTRSTKRATPADSGLRSTMPLPIGRRSLTVSSASSTPSVVVTVTAIFGSGDRSP